MANMAWRITNDNRKKVIEVEKKTLIETLYAWGILAQGYATEYCPRHTGNLAGSIDYGVVEDDLQVQIGTNVLYGKYVEFGTGIYAEEGDGRKTPWVYQDDEGKWHRTSGMHPQPFLRPAIEKHFLQYEDILKENLSQEL